MHDMTMDKPVTLIEEPQTHGTAAKRRRKQHIAEAFGRAAMRYDAHAAFQRQVGTMLLSYLPEDLSGVQVLDLGAGTGYFSSELLQRGASVVCADLSSAMLQQSAQRCGQHKIRYVQCDAEHLPFETAAFDYVFSSLALQWCENLAIPLREIQRVLKPTGQGYFSTLLDGSLYELQYAWQAVDSNPHVNRFLSEKAVKLALAQSGAQSSSLHCETIQQWYPSALSLMKDLKGIGATHIHDRAQGMTSREALTQVEQAYQQFASSNGHFPATYQVCFGVIYR